MIIIYNNLQSLLRMTDDVLGPSEARIDDDFLITPPKPVLNVLNMVKNYYKLMAVMKCG